MFILIKLGNKIHITNFQPNYRYLYGVKYILIKVNSWLHRLPKHISLDHRHKIILI